MPDYHENYHHIFSIIFAGCQKQEAKREAKRRQLCDEQNQESTSLHERDKSA